jgi:hypothetical protein
MNYGKEGGDRPKEEIVPSGETEEPDLLKLFVIIVLSAKR